VSLIYLSMSLTCLSVSLFNDTVNRKTKTHPAHCGDSSVWDGGVWAGWHEASIPS